MYDKTVTVFNYYESATKRVWYPHVIKNVHLETDRAQIVKQYGPESKDNAMLMIRCAEDLSIDGVPYLPPKAWKAQTNELLGQSITFTPSKDIFMLGEWTGAAEINDDDYTGRDAGFDGYMNSRYDNVFRVTSAGSYSVIPHFEIMGS